MQKTIVAKNKPYSPNSSGVKNLANPIVRINFDESVIPRNIVVKVFAIESFKLRTNTFFV
jgi:hypothetical protein